VSIRRGSSAAGLLAALTVLLGLPAAGSAAGAAVPNGPAATTSASEALRFWTPARMRAARPLGMARRSWGGFAGVSSVPAQRADDGTLRASERALANFAEVPDPTAPGSRQNGVVFIVGRFGLGRCSGTSVNAPNMSVVITAAHCVNGGRPGSWYNQNWIFVPGYHDGVRPFGVFVAKWLGTTVGWLDGDSENADVGAAVVSRNERGQRLGAAVGGYGIAWNLSPHQDFDIHGYPAELPFDGATQRLCSGTPFLAHDVLSFLFSGPLNLGVTCAVTGGASGGGWTIHGNVLNSVTDYGYPDDPFTDFGPYFGDGVRDLYRRAARIR
jgi:V8-like Glu-specific endopeptidase